MGDTIAGAIDRSAREMIVIFNPAAGNRRVHRLWQVLDILHATGIRVTLQETTHGGHASAIAAEAAEKVALLILPTI